jgi:hypothetical protein
VLGVVTLRALLLTTVVACASFACAGCADNGGFGVDLTLTFADSVSDVAVSQVKSFSIIVSGDETGTYPVTLDRAANRTERIIYRPKPTSSTVNLDVQALGESALIAEGMQSSIALLPEHTRPADIVLNMPAMPDAGVGDMLLPIDDASMPLQTPDSGMMEDPDMARTPSLCGTAPNTSVQLCEGFEGTLHSAWATHMTDGALSYDDSMAYRGNSSMHIHGNPVTAGTTVDVRISESQTFTPAPTLVYVRAFFYVQAAPANAGTFYSVIQSASPYDGVSLLDAAGGTLAAGDSVNGGYTKSAAVVPLNQWFCLRWQVKVSTSASAGSVTTWVNSTDITALDANEPTEPAAGLAFLSVGFQTYDPSVANPAFDVWMDELIVNNAPVTCTQ